MWEVGVEVQCDYLAERAQRAASNSLCLYNHDLIAKRLLLVLSKVLVLVLVVEG